MRGSREAHEEDYLLLLISCAVRQEEIPERQKKMHVDWGRVFQLAEFHHVTNLLHYKVLGMDGEQLGRWKTRIHEKYSENVKLQEEYRGLAAELEEKLEERKITGMIVGGNLLVPCYPMPEMRMNEPLQILVEKKKHKEIREIMAELGFEYESEKGEKRRKEMPMCFKQPFGARVEFIEELGFYGKSANKWFKGAPRIVDRKKGFKYVRELELNDQYIYLMCRIADRFARGTIEIRDVADLWVFLQCRRERLNWKTIEEEIERLGIELFHEYVSKLANKWFEKLQYKEDEDILEDVRRYIMSRGADARGENELLLPLSKKVADNYFRNIAKEEKDRERRWKFPNREYMEAVYPQLKKWPFLLPVFWVVRLMRTKRDGKC